MHNKNSKSESYIVRQAENVIEKYLSNREVSNVKKYYELRRKYDKLKIITIFIFVTFIISVLLNIIY